MYYNTTGQSPAIPTWIRRIQTKELTLISSQMYTITKRVQSTQKTAKYRYCVPLIQTIITIESCVQLKVEALLAQLGGIKFKVQYGSTSQLILSDNLFNDAGLTRSRRELIIAYCLLLYSIQRFYAKLPITIITHYSWK